MTTQMIYEGELMAYDDSDVLRDVNIEGYARRDAVK